MSTSEQYFRRSKWKDTGLIEWVLQPYFAWRKEVVEPEDLRATDFLKTITPYAFDMYGEDWKWYPQSFSRHLVSKTKVYETFGIFQYRKHCSRAHRKVLRLEFKPFDSKSEIFEGIILPIFNGICRIEVQEKIQGKSFPSMRSAAKELGLPIGQIQYACMKKGKLEYKGKTYMFEATTFYSRSGGKFGLLEELADEIQSIIRS